MKAQKSLNESINEIAKSDLTLDQKKAACIKLGLRPRDVEYLELSGIFNGECLTFGVEIECIVRRALISANASRHNFIYQYEGYNHTDSRDHYKFVTDSSVSDPDREGGESNAIECVSPILNDNKDGFKSLKNCLETLNDAGAKVNRSCGLHVHVGVAKLSGTQLVNIYKNYQKLERLIDSFMAPSRRDDCRWAKSILGFDYSDCDDAADVVELMEYDRYFKVNPMAYSRHKTIEFRQHQGSVDYEKISNWVSFCCKLVEYSKKHVLENEVTRIEDVPFINAEEKAFFGARIAHFAGIEA